MDSSSYLLVCNNCPLLEHFELAYTAISSGTLLQLCNNWKQLLVVRLVSDTNKSVNMFPYLFNFYVCFVKLQHYKEDNDFKSTPLEFHRSCPNLRIFETYDTGDPTDFLFNKFPKFRVKWYP